MAEHQRCKFVDYHQHVTSAYNNKTGQNVLALMSFRYQFEDHPIAEAHVSPQCLLTIRASFKEDHTPNTKLGLITNDPNAFFHLA